MAAKSEQMCAVCQSFRLVSGREQLAKVSAFADRTMTLQATIQDGVIWLSDDKNNLEVNLTAWQQPS